MRSIVDGQVSIFSDSQADTSILEELAKDYIVRGSEEPFHMCSHEEDSFLWSFPWGVLASDYVMDNPIEDNRCLGRDLKVGQSLFNPRMGQEESVASVVRMMRAFGPAMLVAGCGTGKTLMGAEASLRLGKATCVLVHKEFLADQWEEAFEMVCPGIRIGRLQRDRCDTGWTHDVVIAMAQSISNTRREYPPEFYRSFGLLIGDEVHRYAADVWQTAVTKFPAVFRLGLTATPYRGDGFWPVLEEHFGRHQVKLIGERLTPLIYPIKTTAISRLGLEEQSWLSNTQKRAKLLTELADNESRNEAIARNLKKACDAGRKTLIISERRSQLKWLGDRLTAYGIRDCGYYVGGKKMDALDEAATKKVIFSTYQMAKEGLNIPDLDVLIMATPQAHIEQTVGRILRQCEGKGRPTVLDFVDPEIGIFEGLWYSRLKEYKKFGYEISK